MLNCPHSRLIQLPHCSHATSLCTWVTLLYCCYNWCWSMECYAVGLIPWTPEYGYIIQFIICVFDASVHIAITLVLTQAKLNSNLALTFLPINISAGDTPAVVCGVTLYSNRSYPILTCIDRGAVSQTVLENSCSSFSQSIQWWMIGINFNIVNSCN